MRWWDIERLLPLERALFGDAAWTAEAFWSELAHPESRSYVVAVDSNSSDGAIVGYAGLMASGAEADVQTVAVAADVQGHGIGALLVRSLIDQAARRRASALLLEVRADNPAAIALYARHGFERISVRRRYYQPGDVDALVMRLRPVPQLITGS
jgi:ribosomal-protein-alanine N-acetyltransferase